MSENNELHLENKKDNTHNYFKRNCANVDIEMNMGDESVMQTSKRRPIWFIFENKKTSRLDMSLLMNILAIEHSLQKSADTLKPYGIDVLTNINDDKSAKDVLQNIVFVVATYIAQVDYLREIGIKPDGFIGHGVGEIGCGYADGLLTAQQAILCAYWCGKIIQENNAIKCKQFEDDLRKCIPNFKPRPAWWISSRSCDKKGEICNAKYFLENMKSPQPSQTQPIVPEEALIVEISPQQLLNISNIVTPVHKCL